MDAQDKLYQEDYEQASTDDQRTAIRELCSTVGASQIERAYHENVEISAEDVISLEAMRKRI